MAYALFPRPRKAEFGKETIDLSKATWIKVDPGLPARLKMHVIALADALSDALPSAPQVTAGDPAQGERLLSIRLDGRGIKPQGYRLSADGRGIALRACDEAGAFYGLQTLQQLLAQTGARVPAFQMADQPDFQHRGIMLDLSRCKVPTMETLLQIVDMMARLKLNQLQLYTEHTFAFSAHEAVWHDASPVTAEEVLLLDAYCKDRYVELVPNLNSFGHFERWLRHPEYRHLAECPDGFEYPWGGRARYGSVLRPNRNGLRLLDSLYAEFLPNFTSQLFNVGCDETWELGQGWSKKLCEEKGPTRVYLDFLLGIDELVRKHGRTMMFWGDIILHQPDLIGELPEDVVGLVWGYGADHPFDKQCAQFKKVGTPFHVCPGTSSWNSLTGRTSNCLANLANAARNGLRHGAIGYLITDWGDGGHHQYLPTSYPGFFAGAAFSWCLSANQDADIAAAMDDIVLQERTGALGGLILELGKVCELAPKGLPNGTVFNELLFADIGTDYVLEGLTASGLRKCLRKFEQLGAKIRDTRPQVEDGDLVKAELLNAISMARCGAERGLAGLDRKYYDRTALRHAMQHVISRHEQLWLERNRPGGLRESSDRLRKQLKQLT